MVWPISGVDGAGENRIIIIPGANHEIEINKAIKEAINAIAGLAIVVAQCEIKQEVTVPALRRPKLAGAQQFLILLLTNKFISRTWN